MCSIHFRSIARNLSAKNDDRIDETFKATSYSEVDSIIHKTFKKIQNTYDFGESSTSEQFDINRHKLRKNRCLDKCSKSNLEIEAEEDKPIIKETEPEKMLPLKDFNIKRESVRREPNLIQNTSVEILEVTYTILNFYITSNSIFLTHFKCRDDKRSISSEFETVINQSHKTTNRKHKVTKQLKLDNVDKSSLKVAPFKSTRADMQNEAYMMFTKITTYQEKICFFVSEIR